MKALDRDVRERIVRAVERGRVLRLASRSVRRPSRSSSTASGTPAPPPLANHHLASRDRLGWHASRHDHRWSDERSDL